jgi:hypothetical protein
MRHIAVATGSVVALALTITLVAMLVPGRARGQSPADGPPKYTLEVEQADVAALGQALNELPKRVADPLIAKLNAQIQEQMRAHQKARAEAMRPKTEEPKQ